MCKGVQRKIGGELQPPTICFLCGPAEKALYQDSTARLTEELAPVLEGAAAFPGAAAQFCKGGAGEREHTKPDK